MSQATEKKDRKGFSITVKLNLFLIAVILAVAFGTAILAYRINADQIDRYYKQVSSDSAANFASQVDGDFLGRLREAAESEEFQTLRKEAEENEDESIVQEYLEKNGLWEDYTKTRNDLVKYLKNMESIKYLYIIAIGDKNALYVFKRADKSMYEDKRRFKEEFGSYR